MALRAEMGRFRVLLFRDDREWLLQSRDLKPLNRYFPELESTILEQLPSRAVVDGEVVIAGEAGLDFEALQLRVHPAPVNYIGVASVDEFVRRAERLGAKVVASKRPVPGMGWFAQLTDT